MMARIALKTEGSIEYNTKFKNDSGRDGEMTPTDAIGYASSAIARDIGANAIITLTESGFTARMISKFRPITPIISITPNEVVYKQMALVWGATPLMTGKAANTTQLLEFAMETVTKSGHVKKGDTVVIVSGMPVGIAGTTNNIRVHVIGDDI